jgi:hypothetical protein
MEKGYGVVALVLEHKAHMIYHPKTGSGAVDTKE